MQEKMTYIQKKTYKHTKKATRSDSLAILGYSIRESALLIFNVTNVQWVPIGMSDKIIV